ncbi:hypothetical protein G7046_g4241 [Stylonectria norvegica]|nr:hypothetical protein G7046_g4241 [Stylonectria norvegica]
MADENITDQYITYESRLDSFHRTVKKRGSSAHGRVAKALGWPHKSIAPASMARAGLFYSPTSASPDNVICFLCHKGLDGWEADDDPLIEHLKHSPDCGWAIVAAIEAEAGGYATEDPNQLYMKEARKATFAGRWPHEGKKGWKCKTKQLVDAGWKYTPTPDYDDMATCVYCQLALDGWEPGDKPLDEHYNRSPECAFFAMVEESQAAKKSSRTKAGRASKASRLSTQSVATAASEAPSVADLTAALEDSIMTTASTMTVTGKKGKPKKAATSKSKKTKAKKEEPIEIEEVEVAIVEELAPPTKPTRGKKRGSTAVEDSIMTTSEAPAPKKRATRTRGSTAVNSSALEPDDTDMSDSPAPKKGGRKKVRPSNSKSTRKTSTTSVASSTTSSKVPPGNFPDDDEIERQLEADLERPLSEDEEITAGSDSGTLKASSRGAKAAEKQLAPTQQSADYAMFDPLSVELDEEEIDDELKALQAEMEVAEPEPKFEPVPAPEPEEQLHVPKKGRKAATRKVSKQTKSKKAQDIPEPEPVAEEVAAAEPEEDVAFPEREPEGDFNDDSMASTDTVVKTPGAAARPSIGARGRGRPSKASLAAQESTDAVDLVAPPEEPQPKRGRGRPSKASLASRASSGADDSKPITAEAPAKRGRGRPSKKSLEARESMAALEEHTPVETVTDDVEAPLTEASQDVDVPGPVVSFEGAPQSPAIQDVAWPQPPSSSRHLPNPPSTPGRIISPAPSARQAAISPSQSPQSSDAENQPPSSKPAASANPTRVALAPVAATPMRGSPSKRNVIAGLRSTTPWSPLDLDAVLGSPRSSPNKENGAERFLKQGQTLTSPEKRMTVEEWVYHNANEADRKLKNECEAMVSRFESEGTKAMRVLEGLVVD